MDLVLYWFVGVSSACIAAAISLANAPLVALGSVSALTGIGLHKGWDIIEPMLLKRSGMVQILNGYELSGDRKVAVLAAGNGFTATAAALLDTSKTRELDRERLEEIIGRAGVPFKLVMIARPLDTSKVLDRLRTAQYRTEIELSRMYGNGADEVKIRHAKAKLGAIEEDISSITSGKAPLKVLHYVMHAAHSTGRFMAQEEAISGLAALAGAFDAALGTRSKVLAGGELMDALRFDAMVA